MALLVESISRFQCLCDNRATLQQFPSLRLLNQSQADNSCQLKHIQCTNPSFDSCNSGFGVGHCTNTGDGIANETCSVIVFPKGFSGSYKDRTVNCREENGCEAVNCPADCINNPSVDCQCVAEWGLDDAILFEPAFCLYGSADGSCHQQYFRCADVDFNFCSQGYGTGLCINQGSSERNCTVNYYPDAFDKTINNRHLLCENPAGCESLECTDNCHGAWHLNNQTEVAPGNCAPNTGRLCQLRYLHCDHAQFDWCREGYGKGHCQNPVSSENCSFTVFPDHQNEQCTSPGGCEKLSCDSCKADWMINNYTSIFPEGCATAQNDGTCKINYFQCSHPVLDFCQDGYGLGRCQNDHQHTNCIIWFVPDQFSFEGSDGNVQVCQQPSGCEWLNCKNSCTGYGYQGWQETTPGNCLTTVSKSCQLQYFSCDDQKFDSCKGGYGTGTCNNADTVESCSITVYPNGWKASPTAPVLCSNQQGCEQIRCPEGCDDQCDCAGQWQVYGKTKVYPSGCIDYHSPPDSFALALGLGITGGAILSVCASTFIAIIAICACKHSGRRTYQTLN